MRLYFISETSCMMLLTRKVISLSPLHLQKPNACVIQGDFMMLTRKVISLAPLHLRKPNACVIQGDL